MKNVGAHKPMKIPNRSPWAISGSLVIFQTAIEAIIDANPSTKQTWPRIET
jgi:hypothetical protein